MSYATRDLSRGDAFAPPLPAAITQVPPSRRKPIGHPKSKLRRDMMRSLGICINGSFVVPPPVAGPGEAQKAQSRPPTITWRPVVQHGQAVKGGRCQRCINARKGIKDDIPLVGPVAAPTPDHYEFLRLPPENTKRRRFVELLVAGHTPQEVAAIEGTHRQNVHSAVRFARKRGELA